MPSSTNDDASTAAAEAEFVLLIVESDNAIRYDVKSAFEKLGVAVLDAADAETAIHHIRQQTSVNAVLLDRHLDGNFDGISLARTIRSERQDVAVIILTADISALPKDVSTLRTLRKPVENDALRELAESLLRKRWTVE